MTGMELGLCMLAVLSSSLSQLLIKAAAMRPLYLRGIFLLAAGAALMMCSVLLVVVALRTLSLSRLVSFAACAYVLVPLGGHFLFGENLRPRFWLGAFLIMAGILCSNW